MRTHELILQMEATQIMRFEHGRRDVVIRHELPWDPVTFGWASMGYMAETARYSLGPRMPISSDKNRCSVEPTNAERSKTQRTKIPASTIA